MAKLRVAVLFGGRSGEHEISLRSALTVMGALDPQRYEVVPIGIDRDGRWYLRSDAAKSLSEIAAKLGELDRGGSPVAILPYPEPTGKIWVCRQSTLGDMLEILHGERVDVVFPVLHGTYGEDGTVQGLLELAGFAYVGSGVFGSAVGMNKAAQKRILRDAGIPVTEFATIDALELRDNPERAFEIAEHLNYPVYVKPNALGSSIGVSRVANKEELMPALREALRYDCRALIEASCEGRELECAVLGNERPEASTVGEIIVSAHHSFYSYESKYVDPNGAQIAIPADLPEQVIEHIRQLAKATFQLLELRGMARVDLLARRDLSKIVVNEVNTIPGFTAISMYPKLWEACGLPLPRLVDRLIELAVEEHDRRKSLSFTYQPKRSA